MKAFKKLSAALLAALMLVSCACGEENKPQSTSASAAITGRVDALAYEMRLRLDTEKDRLYETVRIHLKNDTDAPLEKLCLRNMAPAALAYARKYYLYEGNEALSAKVEDVKLAGSERALSVACEKDDSVLWITLEGDEAIPSGETAELVVTCETDIPKRQDRFAVLTDDYGKLYTLSFCFPYLADNENGDWITDPFFDDGESRGTDLADYSVIFEAPETYRVAATGANETKDGVTTITAEQARDFAIVACDFMEMETFEVDGITVNNYYLQGPNEAEYRKLSRLAAEDSLRIYTQSVGKLPITEIDIVECLFGFAFGGMEYPGLIMVNGSSAHAGMAPDFFAVSVIDCVAHEMGHQWFYAAVGNREYTEGWLDEGFTTYLERTLFDLADCAANRYLRQVDPTVLSMEALRTDRDEYLTFFKAEQARYILNISPDDYPEDRMYGDGEYNGGYLFLIELELTMGEDAFGAFLKDYYRKNCLKTVTTKDVAQLVRTHSGDSRTAAVLQYWLDD